MDTQLPACILIDDDRLVHLSWNLAAKSRGRRVEGFCDPQAFFLRAHEFDKKIPVYVDLNLGNGFSGDDVSKRIFELGFENIYLSTGNTSVSLDGLSFLKGIIGKDPPVF